MPFWPRDTRRRRWRPIATAWRSARRWLRRIRKATGRSGIWRSAQGGIEILLWRKDLDAALGTCRRSLTIREALVERDSGNNQSQHDLAIGHNKLGDALLAREDAASALDAYTRALRITEELVAADPANRQWQSDLAFCHNRRGEALAAAGEPEAALQAIREGQVIAERLACLDPDNGDWQAELAIGFDRIGALLLHQSDSTAALPHYQRALAIADQLFARAPDDPKTRFDRAEAAYKLSVAIAADPSSRSAADAQLLNTSRQVVADLRAAGWPLPQEAWVQALEAEPRAPGASERSLP